MQPLSTPHAHTRFVDGKNTPEEMALAAVSLGFVSLGFSEHGPQRFDKKCGLSPADETVYREKVKRLKVLYEGKIRIWLGIEADTAGCADTASYEYFIGSRHYFCEGDRFFPVDSSREETLKGIREFFGGDGIAMAKAYYAGLAESLLRMRPDIIGHFDLITKFNEDGALFDEANPAYLNAGKDALSELVKTDALLEINTGAIARGYRKTPYPAAPFLRFWREKGGRVILSSDCHDARQLNCAFDDALERARGAGFTSIARLGAGAALFEEIGI